MADPYVRVRIEGSMPGGEVWSVNPAFIGNFAQVPLGQEGLQDWADDIVASFNTLFPLQLLNLISSLSRITGVRTEAYGPDGRLARYATQVPNAPLAGQNDARLPTTAAVVMSLQTTLPGASNRGRLYWPAMGAVIDSGTARLSLGLCQNIANASVSMLTGLADLAPEANTLVPAVWSKTLQRGIAVRSVRVGDLIDSQRRRRDALVEGYRSAVVPV